MRRRLPSPALVLASIALFAALGGAGYAAATAFVRSAKPITLVTGSMSANGKLVGGLMHGTERSTGVYTLTIIGDTFSPNLRFAAPHTSVTPVITIFGKGAATNPPNCVVSSEAMDSSGGATAEVDCFTYDPAAGWVPADTAFDVQMVGPSR
jgi:hypothetical protein